MIVTGTLTLSMEAADVARFVEDDGAKEALKTGIAAALSGVDASNVEILEVAVTDRRFMGAGRRLGGPTAKSVSVRYLITVPKSKDAHTVAATIAGATTELKNEINDAMANLGLSYSVADLTQTTPVVEGQQAVPPVTGKAAPGGGGLGNGPRGDSGHCAPRKARPLMPSLGERRSPAVSPTEPSFFHGYTCFEVQHHHSQWAALTRSAAD